MLVGLKRLMGEAANAVFGWIFLVVIVGGPYIVARIIPEPAYYFTVYVAWIAFFIGICLFIAAIAKPARRFAGWGLILCAIAIYAFTWVWSVLLVADTWGLVVLYVANFFFTIGTFVETAARN